MWKKYKDTFYEVSIDGRVRAIEHVVNKRDGTTYTCVPKELKPAINTKGYKIVGLSINGKLSTKKVHRLVAECYIDNVNNKPQVNHIDGDKLNNNSNNLEWVTNSENMLHAYRIGLSKSKSGDSFHRTKHSDSLVLEILNKYKCGQSKRSLAREYSVDRSIFKRKIVEINS